MSLSDRGRGRGGRAERPPLGLLEQRPWMGRRRLRDPAATADRRRRSSCRVSGGGSRLDGPREAADRARPCRTAPRSHRLRRPGRAKALLVRRARRPDHRARAHGRWSAVAPAVPPRGAGGGASSKKPLGAGRSRPRALRGPGRASMRLVVLGTGPTGVSRSGWFLTLRPARPGVKRLGTLVLGPDGS